MSPNDSSLSPGCERDRIRTARYPRWMLAFIILTLSALAACDTEIPAPPQITVVITTVNDQQALQQGINQALTGTAVVRDALTATALARQGSTVTPSVTPTPSLTPTLTPTRFVTPTRTPVPSNTPTPTFAPFASNTPAPLAEANNGWLRVINAWRDPRGAGATDPVNVLLNNQQVYSTLAFGQKTNYLQVLPGAVNVSLRLSKEVITGTPTPPLISRVVNVGAGAIVSVLVVDQGKGLELLPLTEDPSPLVTGTSRLTVFQLNPVLMPVNALIPDIQRALAYQMKQGDLVGPLDLPAGTYEIELYDSAQPDQYVAGLPAVQLVNRVSYLLLLLPPASSAEGATSSLLVNGITRRISTDVTARFINVATKVGTLTLTLDGQEALPSLPVGGVSNPLPVPAFGARLGLVNSRGETAATSDLGPWPADQLNTNKLVLIYDGAQGPVVRALAQDALPSAINANVRLIHLLPDTRPLTLEVRSARAAAVAAGAPAGATEVPWAAVGQADFGTASSYERRTPDMYDMRVVLSGSRSVIAELPPTQLLASGIYDIVVMPGEDQGSVQMRLVQPDVQLSGAQTGEGNATAVFEAVAATLTAAAPQAATATPTRISTATATRTPVPTNTPRPSSTPSLPIPILTVDPAPPNTTTGIVNLFGQYFAAGQQYTVTVDRGLEPIFNSRVNPDGTITDSVQLPENLTPGLHILQVCVDCRPRGAQQAAPVVIIVADPRVTATPTPSS